MQTNVQLRSADQALPEEAGREIASGQRNELARRTWKLSGQWRYSLS